MKPLTIRTLAVGVVGLCLVCTASGVGQSGPTSEDDRRAAAQGEILRLGDNLNAADVALRAERIVKSHDSEDISSVFKLKRQGGLGIGKLTEVDAIPDGIGRLMQKLGNRKSITEAEIDKYSADYLRVAKVMQAMAELAPFRANEHVQKSAKLAAEWREVAKEFRTGATEFRKAVDEKDPKKLRLAAIAMQNTCCHCHGLLD